MSHLYLLDTIDTNVFISAALSPKGKAYQAIAKAIDSFAKPVLRL